MYFWKVEEQNDCKEIIAEEEYTRYDNKEPEFYHSMWYGIEPADDPIPETPYINVIMYTFRGFFHRLKVAFQYILTKRIHYISMSLDQKQYDRIKRFTYADSKYVVRCSCIGYHGMVMTPWKNSNGEMRYDIAPYNTAWPWKLFLAKAITFIRLGKVIINAYSVDQTEMMDFED